MSEGADKLRGLLKWIDLKARRLRVSPGSRSIDGRSRTMEDERLTIVPTQQDEGRPRH
jgi:hypothetical protein